MDELQRRALVDRIVQEVLYRAKGQIPQDKPQKGTVALVTSYVPFLKNALAKVAEHYGKDVTYINFGTQFAPVMKEVVNVDISGAQAILELVEAAANIVLIAPSIGLLEDIAAANDNGFVQHLMVRGLLWQRNVGVLLDFQPPRFKRNTFYEKVVTTVQALEEMGVRLMTYKCATYLGAQGLMLVTENDVMQAHKNKQAELVSAVGAIITPAARDKARELGIQIN